MPAVMAAQRPSLVQDECDVAVRTAERRPAGAAMQRGRHAAPVEEQDRLPAPLGDRGQLGQERRRDQVAGFPPQVDDPNGWQLPSEPAAELEPLEALPALGPGRGAPVEHDRSVEGSALRGDRPGVVARVRLLLVRGVVLLVDADHAEVGHGREQRRARADDEGRRPGHDSLSLVAPLRVRERRVENRNAVAEARPQASDGLRSEGDLGDEHDRAAAARERVCAGLEVDLGLAAPRGAVEQEERMLSCVDCLTDACERRLLRFAQLGRGASPASESRSAGEGRSARRARFSGATSASARPGVVP